MPDNMITEHALEGVEVSREEREQTTMDMLARAQQRRAEERAKPTNYGVPFDLLTPKQRMTLRAKHDISRSIYEHLMKYLQPGSGDPAVGSHLEAHGKAVVGRTLRDMPSTGRGTIPANVLEVINSFLRPATVSWRELLRAFVTRTIKSKPQRGMRRISKARAALRLRFAKQLAALKRMPLFPGMTRIDCGVLIPSSRARSFADSLLAVIAEASTPEPTYGMPISSSIFAIVPSSPAPPCIAFQTRSV
jgi:hypothetical protein